MTSGSGPKYVHLNKCYTYVSYMSYSDLLREIPMTCLFAPYLFKHVYDYRSRYEGLACSLPSALNVLTSSLYLVKILSVDFIKWN